MQGEVEWIKLSTRIFEDEKIKVILSMPDGEALFNTWVRLLCLAGKINDHGLVYLADGVAYSAETLATVFNKPASHIRLALETFERLGIVTSRVTSRDSVTETSRDANVFFITNYDKYQNVQGLDDLREKARIRNFEYRKRQKTLLLEQTRRHVTSRVTSRDGTELELERKSKTKKRNPKDGASAPPPPAVDETSLFSAIKAAFLSKNGSFTNWPRECKNIKLIEVYAAKRDPEDPAALACSMINRLWELKAGADKFWKGQPFTPSTLVSLWDRVLETMRANTLDPEIAALIKGFDVTGGKT